MKRSSTRLEAVTAEQIMAMAQEWLDLDQWQTVCLGPTGWKIRSIDFSNSVLQ